MVNSLVAGLSGLRVHQQLIDVVGNNLANSNTPGYKGSRATFAEILTAQLRSASAPTGTVGGTNPQQVGLGVRLGTVDTNMGQGSFQTTGRTFDLAVQGSGFFIVNNGTQDFYTRAGTFGLDSNSDLVDLKNGFKVRSKTGTSINIDTTGLFPPKATETITMKGNLPAKVGGPKAQVLQSALAFFEGTAATITGSASAATFSITQNSTMTIALNGGAPVTITFDTHYGATVTGASAAAEINADLTAAGITGLTATHTGGKIVLTTTLTGTAAKIKVTDGTGSPASTVFGLSTTLVTGTQTAATTATALNALTDNTVDYVSGDKININGVSKDGVAFSDQFIFGSTNDGTTLGALVNFLNATSALDSADTTDGATASLSSGFLLVTGNVKGESSLSLTLSDETSNTGAVSWPAHSMEIDTLGTDQDEVVTSIPVFDEAGLAHNVTLTLKRSLSQTNKWDLTASLSGADETVTAGTISDIEFATDGTLAGIPPTNSIGLTFGSGATATLYTITLDFGTPGGTDGLTHFGDTTTAQAALQDGYSEGALSTISVRSDGVIQGVYTNGQIQDLGELGVASFANPQGLLRTADTLFAKSTNSGDPTITSGATGNSGSVQSGVLENSNVDVAEEFVKLVEAQRGFQAAAKVIQTTDQMLGDLNSLR